MSDPVSTSDIAAMSFEDALAELEQIVRRLEAGQVKLDEAIQCYERGAQLKSHCEQKLNEAQRRALQVAAAIEMVHAYSLIHDDLPAMDNSDLRRGRPTSHKQFDEATAVLAGDGLLTMAFQVLADPDTHGDAAVRAELVSALAGAAGAAGMVGGQMIDLIAEKQPLNIGAITRL